MSQTPIFFDVPSPRPPVLEARGISKQFPGVAALQNVSLELHVGQVLGVVGENGAGKSTLMKILSGALTPDEGEILLDGHNVNFSGIRQARKMGVALISQESMFAPNLEVAAHIFLGGEPRGLGILSPLRKKKIRDDAGELLQLVGLEISPRARMRDLTPGQVQLVEIARAVALQSRVLILDEPTSSLTSAQTQRLWAIITDLQQRGAGLIFISHKLDEVLKITDRIVVLRDGQRAGELGKFEATHQKLVNLMVGREFVDRPVPVVAPAKPRPILLEVRNLVVPGTTQAVSFNLRSGEILGFAGLVGAGRTELMQTLFGVTPALSGQMWLDAKPYAPRRPGQAIARGVCLAPEDRKRHGLILRSSILENIALPNLRFSRPRGLWRRSAHAAAAQRQIQQLGIRCRNVRQKVALLSGGNQQKVVLAKWLAGKLRILIVDEPTRGIDVAAKAEIYRLLGDLAQTGVAILLVSSELEEVLRLSTRVAVMRQRQITAILQGDQIDPQRVGSLMMGA